MTIKLPPMPEWLRLPPFRDDVQAYARKAVRLNTEVVRPAGSERTQS